MKSIAFSSAFLVTFSWVASGCFQPQSDQCIVYIACQEAVDDVTDDNTGGIEDHYGIAGDCWVDAASAAECTADCVDKTETLKDEHDLVECGGSSVAEGEGEGEGEGNPGGTGELVSAVIT